MEFNTAKDGYSAIAIKSWALYNRDVAQYIHVNGIGVTDTIASILGRNSSSTLGVEVFLLEENKYKLSA